MPFLYRNGIFNLLTEGLPRFLYPKMQVKPSVQTKIKANATCIN